MHRVHSDYNSIPEVIETLNFASEVFIVDSTIRSLQSGISGSRHTARDLIVIGKALDELGVRELIVNLSWKDGLAVCEGLASESLRAKIVGTFRARHPLAEKWARDGIRAGVNEVCFESAHDGEHLQRLVDPVKDQGKLVSHAFAEGYSYPQVVDLCRRGVALQVQSQSFHDSFFEFGITPEAVKFFYRSVRADVPKCPPLYVHLSNFFGHATMTAVAALAAGASAPDVSMNGIGHHCGHISLAEVTMVLEAMYGVKTGIQLGKLREVSTLVRDLTGIPVPLASPIVGDFAFMTDGSYWAAEAHLPLERRVHAKFPIAPSVVGSEERVIWSDRTITPESIKARLSLSRVQMSDDEQIVERIALRMRDLLGRHTQYPSWLLDAELERICREATDGV